MADLNRVVIYLISLTTCYVLTQDPPLPIIDVCKQLSPCSCRYSDGKLVDLTPLSNNNSTAPRFFDIPSQIIGSAKYSWNPCHSFNEGEGCINVTLCEVIAGAPFPKYVPIGKMADGVFDHNQNDGGLQLQYSITGEENRTAYIVLFCNESADGEFVVKGEEPAGSLKYNCYNRTDPDFTTYTIPADMCETTDSYIQELVVKPYKRTIDAIPDDWCYTTYIYFELRSKHVCGGNATEPIVTIEPPSPVTIIPSPSGMPPIIDVCRQLSPCSCKYSNGDILDLGSLSNSDNSKPRFEDMPSEIIGGAKYSWNPCHSFTEGTGCKDVTLCEVIAGAPIPKYVPIGKLNDAVFDHDTTNGNLQLQYSITGEENRTAFIRLFCNKNEDGQFIVKGEEVPGSGEYFFELESVHVCRASQLPSKNDGLSPGAIVAIIFVSLVGAYLLFGMAFQKLINNASGKEIIPNYHFWASVGSSIKAGVVYVFTCGRSEYTEIQSTNSERTPISTPQL